MAEAAEVVRKEGGQFGRGASPLVSVVVPAYNCASVIGEALESVCRQTYAHWEAIVVDDGSTDETRAALAPYMGRIRYFHQMNQGTAAARNAGVRQARGELIAFLDNDDVWLPEKLALQVQVMEGSAECGLVFTDGKTFTTGGILHESVISSRLDGWIAAHRSGDSPVVKGYLIRELLFANEIATASSVMVRRECVESAGGFDDRIEIANDYDLWLRIARAHPVALIRRCLYMWRWHDGSQSGPIAERKYRWIAAGLVVLEKHLSLVPAEARASQKAHMARLYWETARYHFGLDQFRQAREMLIACLRHNCTFLPAMIFLLASGLGRPVIHGARRVARGVRAWEGWMRGRGVS